MLRSPAPFYNPRPKHPPLPCTELALASACLPACRRLLLRALIRRLCPPSPSGTRRMLPGHRCPIQQHWCPGARRGRVRGQSRRLRPIAAHLHCRRRRRRHAPPAVRERGRSSRSKSDFPRSGSEETLEAKIRILPGGRSLLCARRRASRGRRARLLAGRYARWGPRVGPCHRNANLHRLLTVCDLDSGRRKQSCLCHLRRTRQSKARQDGEDRDRAR